MYAYFITLFLKMEVIVMLTLMMWTLDHFYEMKVFKSMVGNMAYRAISLVLLLWVVLQFIV